MRYTMKVAGVTFHKGVIPGWLGLMGVGHKIHVVRERGKWLAFDWHEPVPRLALAKAATMREVVEDVARLFEGEQRAFEVGGIPYTFRVVGGRVVVTDVYLEAPVLASGATFAEAHNAAARVTADRFNESVRG